jgi:hypothetical protein
VIAPDVESRENGGFRAIRIGQRRELQSAIIDAGVRPVVVTGNEPDQGLSLEEWR